MSRGAVVVGVVLVLGLAVAAPSWAQSTPGDFVRGAVTAADGPTNPVTITFDVTSGPAGENPSGSVLFRREGGFFHRSAVTCLNVVGNHAVIGARIVEEGNTSSTSFLGWTLNYDVVDGGPGSQDRVAFDHIDPTGAPPSCTGDAGSQQEFAPIVAGNLDVFDAPRLPTSKEQCKDGGWRSYGVFKNQGQCVSFVNHPSATGGAGATRSSSPGA